VLRKRPPNRIGGGDKVAIPAEVHPVNIPFHKKLWRVGQVKAEFGSGPRLTRDRHRPFSARWVLHTLKVKASHLGG
jgi:hypothetical protein